MPNFSWTPKYSQSHCEAGDYQHNVYIPGTTSGYGTSKLAHREELDMYNTFSTFGKKTRFISHYDKEDGVVNKATFK